MKASGSLELWKIGLEDYTLVNVAYYIHNIFQNLRRHFEKQLWWCSVSNLMLFRLSLAQRGREASLQAFARCQMQPG